MTANDIRSSITAILQDAVARGVAPGAVASVARRDSPTVTVAVGSLASHGRDGQPSAEAEREPTTIDTVYDLASITKIFTAITVLSLADRGILDLDAPISAWLPSYRVREKSGVTLAHLLSHTAGLPATWNGWHERVSDEGTGRATWRRARRSDQLDQILALELVRPPGIRLEYSCVNYITAMAVAERATRTPWPSIVAECVLGPLGLVDTTFTPPLARTAPTEFQPHLGRGMVRGIVHDETANALNGASANAGLFSTAGDLVLLGRAVLAGLPGILGPSTFERLWNNQLPAVVGDRAAGVEAELGFGQALGFRIGQTSWMGGHAGQARGHNGFTGTSLFVDRRDERVVVLLTNRVHPTRTGPELSPVRAAIGELAYSA